MTTSGELDQLLMLRKFKKLAEESLNELRQAQHKIDLSIYNFMSVVKEASYRIEILDLLAMRQQAQREKDEDVGMDRYDIKTSSDQE